MKKEYKRIIPFILGIIAIISLIFFLWPRYQSITVDSKYWEREIRIETNTLVEDSDWSVPINAVEIIDQRREIHHYDTVLDHYETITEQKSREVLDGYDISYSYHDLGNGFAEQIEHKTPKYRTEYYTETHEEPVYRQEPVYKIKYYYTIWKYIYDYSITTNGNEKIEPFWGEYTFIGDQREGGRRELYQISYIKKDKTKTLNVKDLDSWNYFHIGRTYTIKIFLNEITEIKGRE